MILYTSNKTFSGRFQHLSLHPARQTFLTDRITPCPLFHNTSHNHGIFPACADDIWYTKRPHRMFFSTRALLPPTMINPPRAHTQIFRLGHLRCAFHALNAEPSHLSLPSMQLPTLYHFIQHASISTTLVEESGRPTE